MLSHRELGLGHDADRLGGRLAYPSRATAPPFPHPQRGASGHAAVLRAQGSAGNHGGERGQMLVMGLSRDVFYVRQAKMARTSHTVFAFAPRGRHLRLAYQPVFQLGPRWLGSVQRRALKSTGMLSRFLGCGPAPEAMRQSSTLFYTLYFYLLILCKYSADPPAKCSH